VLTSSKNHSFYRSLSVSELFSQAPNTQHPLDPKDRLEDLKTIGQGF